MGNTLLPFIDDQDLRKASQRLITAAQNAAREVERDPYRNVIDPFSALVDAARQGIPVSEWMQQEVSRQTQKSFQNALGDFHQDILGSIPGWENAGRGGSYDVVNSRRGIIAEVKNKYNTMNARSALSVYDSLSRHLDYGGTSVQIAYLVEIIPKSPRPYIVPFAPSERGISRQRRENLLKIDGPSFYALSSGYSDAIRLLYDVLPIVIAELLEIDSELLLGSNEFSELFTRAYVKR